MKFTIRIKLLIGFTLLLVLSSLIHALTFNFTRQYITAQIDNMQTLAAERGADEVEKFFSTLRQDSLGITSLVGQNVATTSAVQSTTLAPVADYLLQNKTHIKKITLLSITGQELKTFDHTGAVPVANLLQQPTDPYVAALSGKTSISKVYFFENQPFLDMYAPVFGEGEKVVAVIKLQTTLAPLQKKIAAIRVGKEGLVYVVDSDGKLLVHQSEAFVRELPDFSPRRLITKAIEDQSITGQDELYTNEKKVEVIAKIIEIPEYNWFVVFEQPVSEAFGFLNFIRDLFIFALVGSFVFLLLISLFLSENLTNPIRKLQKSASLLETGQLKTPIDIKSGDEIETLSHSFATMVNELLQREKKLQQDKHETETLLQSLTDGVVALDQSGVIIAFNKAAEQATGMFAANILGKKVDDALHFTENQEAVPFSVYSQQTDATIRKLKEKGLHLTKNDGQRVTLGLTVKPLMFETQKSGFLITFYDMSKEQELEEMKLDFVSMAAHELRTPLTAIRGYASLLQMQTAKFLDPQAKELIKRLVVSSETLGNLIENLLSVSRIERSAFSVDARPVDLTNTIKTVVDSVKQQAYTKKQTLTLLLPNSLPVVRADAFRIGQVLLNLVANAIHYTQEGGAITVTVEKKDTFLQVAVKDNGRGIPKEAISKLFSKFFRVSGSLEQGAKGTGLGLYISKSIITMHKGNIWVESEGVGKGSTFAFALPITTPEEMAKYQQEKAATSSLTGKILPGMIGEKK